MNWLEKERTGTDLKVRGFIPILMLVLIVAWSPAWSLSASWPDLSQPGGAKGGGERDAAVIVGAENYPFVAKVPGGRQNAEDWHAYLTESLKVPSEKVALLRDNEATLEKMRKFAARAASEVEPGGTLWFIFIGHGAPSKDGKDGILVGADAQQDADSLYARSLARNELLGILSKGKQARTVVLLDACFSGRSSSGEALVAGLQPLILTRSPQAAADNRTILLTAAKSDQFAGPLPKAQTMRPAFSYLALGALRGWAADASGKVTASAIVDFARKALALDKGRTQTPELTAGVPGTVLGVGKEAAPNLARIDRGSGPSGGGSPPVSSPPAVPSAQAPAEPKTPAAAEPPALKASGKGLTISAQVDKKTVAIGEKVALSVIVSGKSPPSPELPPLTAFDAVLTGRSQNVAFGSGSMVSSVVSTFILTPKSAGRTVIGPVSATLNGERVQTEPIEIEVLQPKTASGASAPPQNAVGGKVAAGMAGIEWVTIPGGTFMMGSDNRDQEAPKHSATVTTFQMAKTEVTNKQYRECVAAGACTPAHSLDGTCHVYSGSWKFDLGSLSAAFLSDDHPVVCVTWHQAKAFSEWAGGRLPSETEWEYAARGAGKDRKYPWGDEEPSCARAILKDGAAGCGKDTTWPVCSKVAGNTEQGLCDMAGNVWEWTRDWFHPYDRGVPDAGEKENPLFRDWGRIERGGAFMDPKEYVSTTVRSHLRPSGANGRIGFRPVR